MEIFNVSKRTEELCLMRLIQHEDVSTKHAVQHAIRDVRWYNFHVATRADRNVLCVRILSNQRQFPFQNSKIPRVVMTNFSRNLQKC